VPEDARSKRAAGQAANTLLGVIGGSDADSGVGVSHGCVVALYSGQR